jgi:hypothetical protein
MPINCPIAFPRLSEAEMRAIDYPVMGYAFEIHRELGCLCDESVYHNHLSEVLAATGFDRKIDDRKIGVRIFLSKIFLSKCVLGKERGHDANQLSDRLS